MATYELTYKVVVEVSKSEDIWEAGRQILGMMEDIEPFTVECLDPDDWGETEVWSNWEEKECDHEFTVGPCTKCGHKGLQIKNCEEL